MAEHYTKMNGETIQYVFTKEKFPVKIKSFDGEKTINAYLLCVVYKGNEILFGCDKRKNIWYITHVESGKLVFPWCNRFKLDRKIDIVPLVAELLDTILANVENEI